MKAIRKNRELSFDVYCAEGGNQQGTLRALKKDHKLSLTRDTLRDWVVKYKFEERRIQVDAQRQADSEALRTARAQILVGLLDSKAWYDEHFKEQRAQKKAPNNMDTFAYNGIAAQIRQLIGKIDPEGVVPITDKVSSEEAMRILREHYGVTG